ncbi:DUF2393 family protein [Sulfurospirillum sp. T05]|uniref:DUF2393 family protein n=1 Tax=Sulfurospirillum tamanense TaxID=2813362 RepID=A0ABS2WQN5_9BACT|nr:DUF2393 family protein [Sulfurospirillum tamanensis]MBN2963991.1 DUF2393 family protein [Sulfurospirillum tamanensis]
MRGTMETAKHPLLVYISHFQMGDYIAFAWLILLFFLFIFLAILLAKKRPGLAIIIVLLDLALLFGAPFFIKYYLDRSLRSHQLTLNHVQQLLFSQTLILQGSLANTSPKPFAWCRVSFMVVPKKEGELSRFLATLKPLHQTSISIQTPLSSTEVVPFETVIEPFRLDEETMEVVTKAECY